MVVGLFVLCGSGTGSLSGTEIQKTILENGLEILLVPKKGVPVVTIVASDRSSLGPLELSLQSLSALGDGPLGWGRRAFRLEAELEEAIASTAALVASREPDITAGEVDFLARKLLG